MDTSQESIDGCLILTTGSLTLLTVLFPDLPLDLSLFFSIIIGPNLYYVVKAK